MTAFGKLIRTTAFRLTLVYLLLFALFAASLLGYFAWNTRRLITEQITSTVNAEVGEVSDIYARRGLRGLVFTIENRALRPGANLYLVTTPTGQAVAGNVSSLGPGVMASLGWSETAYRRLDEQDKAHHRALVRVTELTSGFRLLIGRDLEERRRLFGIVAKAAQWSLLVVVVLGLGGGVFVARRVLRRIDAMTGTTQRIMAGDLSGRLPVGRSGDELDRLAENLNAMLERIEALMTGLKEVSDNIAHDLKTPLTRLRNRAEEALAKSRSEAEYRSALERTIEESDGLIRTFNALLMIARAESGQARGNMDDFDAADVAEGIQELYEPLAEDGGMTLIVRTSAAPVHGNRELISQALANLVENAIKYGKPLPTAQPPAAGAVAAAVSKEIVIEARRDGGTVLLSVTDHGPGIPEADRSHAVERFVRLEAEPHPARFRPWLEPGLGGGDAAWRRAQARRCTPGTIGDIGDPGAGRRQRQACGSNAGCATEGGMTSSAKGDADQHRLAARFVGGPHVSAPDKAEQRLADWLTDLAPAQAAVIGDLVARFPFARAILLGIAEASPYLFDLMRADAARAIRLLECEPEPYLVQLIENTCRDVSAASGEADVMQSLRRMKSEAALLIALCDIGGVWPVMQVTAALTDLAVASVQAALRFLLRQEAGRGRLLPPDPDSPEDNSGLVVLAMGKMGAGELNYSSDIDLIVFFDSEAPTLAPDIEPQTFFVRVTQALARILQQRNGDGYVFRVDLRLRPDPSSTQVAISMAAALHYYERDGRTWERAAMIKARPCAGDAKAGEALVAEIAPFVWRKHLDFAALADVHDMKRQMQTFRGQNEIAVEGHNVKVGRGGIREIEFFAQTQQLIAGGRHPELRVRPTLEALEVLAASNWITFAARDELDRGLHLPAAGRTPAADGRGRADPRLA